MKYLTIVVAMFAATATASAFAQTNSSNTPATSVVAQVASNDGSTAQSQSVAAYGQPVHEKTRAEVYQELVHAEQDGQLAYLNSTVYAHP
ncbi:DUF4148 domain-containing protein [Paraburkholderia fungorum]|uniref:DUF4148 domain-containing protein n=1 Tax=Paraburkholderia fungorum TaxID=134537 RepID=UPI0038B7798B